MKTHPVLEAIRGGLVVSCQAQESDPLYGAGMMTNMAIAAQAGGAVGIRANGFDDIQSIKQVTGLPVIGIVKRTYAGSDVYITPTMLEVDEIARGGADIVALDCTHRIRPGGIGPVDLIAMTRQKYPDMLIMADVSTFEEAIQAERAHVDLLASTLSGYTSYSPQFDGPDYALLTQMCKLQTPVVAEGRIQTPEQARKCLQSGAFAVVVGSAITRPQEITRTFVEYMGFHQHSPSTGKIS